MAATARRDKPWRDAEKRLGWCAIVGFGYEAGAWVKLAATRDIEAYAKVGRSHHPETYEARFVLWCEDDVIAGIVLAQALKLAKASRQVLNGSCVALPVAAASGLVIEAAQACNVTLKGSDEHAAAVEVEMRRGWR